MVTVEIILILIGVVFLIGSFFVKDKLSQKDVEKIAELSEDEINIIVEKQLNKAEGIIEDKIDEKIDEAQEKTVRAMEKESNEKIMSISEYSDTVLESMNKTHNEIMFLYSMLNDKQKDLNDFASEIQGMYDKASNHDAISKYSTVSKNSMKSNYSEDINDSFEKNDTPILENFESNKEFEMNSVNDKSLINNFDDLFANETPKKTDNLNRIFNNNENILRLHRQGINDVEIAKELNLGLGEVKLVIGLYRGDNTDEI